MILPLKLLELLIYTEKELLTVVMVKYNLVKNIDGTFYKKI